MLGGWERNLVFKLGCAVTDRLLEGSWVCWPVVWSYSLSPGLWMSAVIFLLMTPMWATSFSLTSMCRLVRSLHVFISCGHVVLGCHRYVRLFHGP